MSDSSGSSPPTYQSTADAYLSERDDHVRSVVREVDGPKLSVHQARLIPRGWVRINVELVGVCRTDVAAARGELDVARGRILGHEVVGRVIEVSEGVDADWLGLRVGVLPLRPCGECSMCRDLRSATRFDTSSPLLSPLLSPLPSPYMRDLPALTHVGLLDINRCERPHHLGVELDGAFTDKMMAPVHDLYPLPDELSAERAAYVEPVAASLAPLATLQDLRDHSKLSEPIWIWGEGRIALLTQRCLTAFGFHVEICSTSTMSDESIGVSCLIETATRREGLTIPLTMLRPKGTLILKSRYTNDDPFPIHLAVRRELTLVGVHYAPFAQAIALLSDPDFVVEDLFGPRYALTDFERALTMSESRKVFLEPHQSIKSKSINTISEPGGR